MQGELEVKEPQYYLLVKVKDGKFNSMIYEQIDGVSLVGDIVCYGPFNSLEEAEHEEYRLKAEYDEFYRI